MHFKLQNLENHAGFADTNTRQGEVARVVVRAAVTSAEPMFHRYLEQLTAGLLSPVQVPPDGVHQFLAVIHAGGTGDLYVNDFPIHIEMKARRGLTAGGHVLHSDIADIRRLRFLDVSIQESDRIVYVFKVNWRFGLYFDFVAAGAEGREPTPAELKLDINRVERDLGDLYRQLAFYNLYEVLKTNNHFDAMMEDGWFPFIELLPTDFNELSRVYSDRFNFDEHIRMVVDRFDEARIGLIAERWWSTSRFEAKRDLLQAGLDAYLSGTPAGFINSIKTLTSEIEGLLRDIYRSDTGAKNVKQKQFLAHIAGKARAEAGSDFSLLMAGPFLEYLRTQTFASFDVAAGHVPLSRHSAAHGEAGGGQYTKARALQAILVLDQIFHSDNQLPALGSESSVDVPREYSIPMKSTDDIMTSGG